MLILALYMCYACHVSSNCSLIQVPSYAVLPCLLHSVPVLCSVPSLYSVPLFQIGLCPQVASDLSKKGQRAKVSGRYSMLSGSTADDHA